MTINDAQELVRAWRKRHSIEGDRAELIAFLIERLSELGELVENSDGSDGSLELSECSMGKDFSDVCWHYMSLASDLGVDLESSLLKALTKRGAGARAIEE